MSIVEAKNLRKVFDGQAAVDNLSFEVREGEIFGLLGPNGAGKSTTISMLSCLLGPTSGEASIDGKSVAKQPMAVKKVLGVIPQEIALYPTLTARENLHFWARMYGLSSSETKKKAEEILKIVELTDRASDRIETYSGGMKRRINIAAGLLHNPKVLLMDEPTVGIDPQSRNHILETVKKLNQDGLTVIYTSHYMEEVEFLCDRIAIMDGGKIIAQGTKDELRLLIGDKDIIRAKVSNADQEKISALKNLKEVEGATLKDEAVDVISSHGRKALPEVISFLIDKGVEIHSIEIQEPDLESVFLHLTGKTLRD